MEAWKPVLGISGYEVSDLGRVRFLDRVRRNAVGCWIESGRILTPKNIKRRGKTVQVSVSIKNSHRFVHRLVLEAFVGPCPEGMECCHNDGNAENNALENLRWDTSASNKADAIRMGTFHRGERSGSSKLAEDEVRRIRELKATGLTQREVAARFKVSESCIRSIWIGRTWKHLCPALATAQAPDKKSAAAGGD